jgi:quinol monooxygenase YgiN
MFEISLTEALDSGSCKPRPMIAVLKARAGMENSFRSLLTTLAQETRKEAGCLRFELYEAFHAPGTFYLFEVYQDNIAFLEHLQSATVSEFKADLAQFSDSSQSKDMTQLIDVPEP